MTDPHSHCERWHLPISLLAAGCLPAEEEPAVRQHLAECAACAARFAELTALCACLARNRPSAKVPTAAICQCSNEALEGPLPQRPFRPTPAMVFWGSGVLAASLLIAIVWRYDRPPASPPGVAPAPGVAQRLPLPTLPPSPQVPATVAHLQRQPTLYDYELALARSDEAFDALSQQHSKSIVFKPYDSRSLLQESD